MSNLARAIHGIPVVASETERDALFPTPERDQRVQVRTSGAIQRYTGTAWQDDIPGGLGGMVSVAAYGADPTGVADSTAAFIAAAAAGKRVYVPEGTYLLGAVTGFNGCHFIGASRNTTTLKQASATVFEWSSAVNGSLLKFCRWESLTFDGSLATEPFFDLSDFQQCSWYNVTFRDCAQKAMRWVAAYFNVMQKVCLEDCTYGLHLAGTSFNNGPNFNQFLEFTCENTKQYNFLVEYSRGNLFDNCDAEYGNDATFAADSAFKLRNSSYNLIRNFWYEALFAAASIPPAISIDADSVSNNKGNVVEFAAQIIHPGTAITVNNSQDSRLRQVRIVDATIGVDETGNTDLLLEQMLFEGCATEVDYASNSTRRVDADGTVTVQVSAQDILNSNTSGFNSRIIQVAGVEKHRVTVNGTNNDVDHAIAGNVVVLRYKANGDVEISRAAYFPNTTAAANAVAGSLFVDSADSKLKFKDAASVVNLLY